VHTTVSLQPSGKKVDVTTLKPVLRCAFGGLWISNFVTWPAGYKSYNVIIEKTRKQKDVTLYTGYHYYYIIIIIIREFVTCFSTEYTRMRFYLPLYTPMKGLPEGKLFPPRKVTKLQVTKNKG
jgi:hypothetical protein